MADRQTIAPRPAGGARPGQAAPAPTSLRRPATRPRRRRGSGCLIFILSLSVVLLLAVTAGLVGGALLYTGEMIPPGLASFGIPLGGQPRAAAEQQLQQAWQARTVAVDLAGAQRALRPADLGVTLDVTSTVGLAYAEGRSSNALAEMLRDRRLEVQPTNIEPVWKFDPAAADATLQALARATYIPPRNATIQIVNGQVETTSSEPGRALDVAASGELLGRDPWGVVTRGTFKPVFVPVRPQVVDLQQMAARVAPYLSAPVAVHLYDPIANEAQEWQITPQEIGTWIAIKDVPEGSQEPALGFDEARVRSTLAGKSAGLGSERYIQMDKAVPAIVQAAKAPGGKVSLRINHNNRVHTVQAGDTFSSIADAYGIPYPWIQKANPGVGDALRPGQTVKVPSVDVMVPMPAKENKRLVVSLKQQKMWAYENGKVKWEWPASTGMSFSPTAPGIFQIQTHEPNAYAANWDLWMPYFMGVYRPVPDVDFMNGFHGFPKRGGTQILWTNDLGRPITYGCILVSSENAKQLYNWAEDGVVVEIRRG